MGSQLCLVQSNTASGCTTEDTCSLPSGQEAGKNRKDPGIGAPQQLGHSSLLPLTCPPCKVSQTSQNSSASSEPRVQQYSPCRNFVLKPRPRESDTTQSRHTPGKAGPRDEVLDITGRKLLTSPSATPEARTYSFRSISALRHEVPWAARLTKQCLS